VDPFALAMLGLLAGGILWVILVGKFSSRRGMEDALGWKSAREVMERREALDAEDVNSMIAARNARRRARGEREVTLEEMEYQVSLELREQRERQERYLAERREQRLNERDLDGLLEATNARRRARGEVERTREQAREEFGRGSDPSNPGHGRSSPPSS
jgi:hypothetical protein